MDNIFNQVIDKILNYNKIAIFSHINPDGDSIGSEMGLYNFLKQMGKKDLVVINQDKVPYKYKFMINSDVITDKCPDNINEYLAICVDSSEEKRLGIVREYLTKCKEIINIDHHESNTYFGNINLVITNASSTAEIIYLLIKKIPDFEKYIDISCAEALYSGILTDTGRFSYVNTTGNVLRIAGELLDYGVDAQYVSNNIFNNEPMEYYVLLGRAMENIELFHDGKVAIMKLPRKLLSDLKEEISTENFVNYARSIRNVEIAVFLKEDEDGFLRGSFRSKGNIMINDIAKKYSGGGHPFAAGFRTNESLELIKEDIVRELGKLIKKYEN